MLSRVADSIFWLGRYTERAENYARFIDVNFNLSLDLPPGMKEQWQPLISASGDRDFYVSLNGEDFSREKAIYFLGFDERNQNSIASVVENARENARTIRENIPRESWEVINDLYYFIQEQRKKSIWKSEQPNEAFRQIKLRLQTLNGVSYDTVPRTQGWYFNTLGHYLERADKTSRMLDVKYHFLLPSLDDVGSPLDFLHWAALLKSVSAFNAYRQMHGKISPTHVVEYLVLNRYFPRSVLFCLNEAENCLHEISGSKRGYSNPVEKLIGNLRSDMEYADVGDLFDKGLHEYLDNLQQQLNEISNEIYNQYFKLQPNFTAQNQEQ